MNRKYIRDSNLYDSSLSYYIVLERVNSSYPALHIGNATITALSALLILAAVDHQWLPTMYE